MKRERGKIYTVCLMLLAIGGGFAWGPGGALFGCGLWLAFAIIDESINDPTGEKQ